MAITSVSWPRANSVRAPLMLLFRPQGFFRNAAKKDPNEGYKTLVEGTPVYMHPSSSLFQRPPECEWQLHLAVNKPLY